jgi:hypothetical protein
VGKVRFVSMAFVCVALSPDAVVAQAATGGTKDTAPPPMVVPIRPRDEPATSRPVPNVYQQSSRTIRLRRIRPIQAYPRHVR